MNFQCKNCGGNMVYSPKFKKMYCPYCDGQECHEKKGDHSLTACASCGGEININEFTSASKCPYCGNYLIFDERVEGDYKPDSVIPFMITKEEAVDFMEKEFGKRVFTPSSFLSEKSLEGLQGFYVPFFLYDYVTDSDYVGEGTKVRRWRQGDYDYTETSYYDIVRKMHADYDNIPVDASLAMPDGEMDLLEPFDYNELMEFKPEYLSGFFGEIYNDSIDNLEKRAVDKLVSSTSKLMHDSLAGYSTTRAITDTVSYKRGKVDFSLFPVWLYIYKYRGKSYRFFVNGQNGKVIGVTPVSKLKVVIYSIVSGGLLLGALEMLIRLWGAFLR